MKLSGWILLFSSGIFMLGCGQQEKITHYQVAKVAKKPAPPVATPTAEPARMLGAIVPQGAATWFFKLTGPPDEVASHQAEFDELLASLSFAGGEPAWKEPAGWQRQPGDGFRFATLKVAEAAGIDVSVSSLPSGEEGDMEEYALKNINRWRDQLGLAPATAAEMADETKPVAERRQIAGGPGFVIDFEGVMSGSGMGRTPASAVPPKTTPPPAAAKPARMLGAIIPQGSATWFFKLTGPPDEVAQNREKFDSLLASLSFTDGEPVWKLPDGWQQLPGDGFRFATLKVADAGGIDISVSSLASGEGGDATEYALLNINRWRGQLGQQPATPEQLADASQNIAERRTVAGAEAYITDIEGASSAGGGMGRGPFQGKQ
ncbi:MAG: hypothetical protein AB7O62_02645 [Pirellulales bacterium]